jgi:Alginate export
MKFLQAIFAVFLIFLIGGRAARAQAVQTPAALAAQATVSTDQPRDEINEELPSWLTFAGEIRLRGEGLTGGGFKPDSDDAYLLTRLQLSLKADATKWLRFFIMGQDSHVLGESFVKPVSPYQDEMDLRFAYVEFGDTEKARFGLRLGRQALDFGEQRLVGSANWLNDPHSFDGARATFRGDTYQVDVFAACLDRIRPEQFDECTPGNDIYGLYTVFSKIIPNSKIEPYFFWRRQSGVKDEEAVVSDLHEGTLGFRWAGKIPNGFDYSVEMARQVGSLGADSIGAWAGHWLAGYTLAKTRFTPRLFAEYNYASGDNNSTDGHRGTFDQLYPSAHDLYGLDDQVGWKNIRHIRTGVAINPKPVWMLGVRCNSYWLANPNDALYAASSAIVAKSSTGTAGTFVGQELDLVTSYKFMKQASFSLGLGHLFPGTFLKNTTPGISYTYPYGMLTYDF